MRRKFSRHVLIAILLLVAISLIATTSYLIPGPPDFAAVKSIVHAWSHSPSQKLPTITISEHRVENEVILGSNK